MALLNSTFKSDTDLDEAINRLRSVDESLAKIVDQVGSPHLPNNDRGFQSIARIVIGQQLSTKAARSVYKAVCQCLDGRELEEKTFCLLSPTKLNQAGLSRAKARCLLELSQFLVKNPYFLSSLEAQENSEIQQKLTQFWGIGQWTAQIYLIFSLKRKDIFPITDGSLQRAMSKVYGFDTLDSNEARQKIENWNPVRTAAALLMWHWLDEAS